MNGAKPSSWITYADDTTRVNAHYLEPCHASILYESKGAKGLIAACPKSDVLSLDYINYLSRGPFRAFQDKISLEKFDKHFIIRVTDLDQWPANVLYNYAIATRAPIEHMGVLKSWAKMAESGIDENLAYAIVPYLASGNSKSMIGSPRHLLNHFHFDPTVNLHNLISGQFDSSFVSKQTYFEHPQAGSPTNIIWGRYTSAEYYNLRGKTPDELMDFFDLRQPVLIVTEDPQILEYKAEMIKLAKLKIEEIGLQPQHQPGHLNPQGNWVVNPNGQIVLQPDQPAIVEHWDPDDDDPEDEFEDDEFFENEEQDDEQGN